MRQEILLESGPLTEPESLAIYNFTLAHNFRLILTYHTQGKVIYWKYQNFNPIGAEYIGKEFSNASGYLLESTPYASRFCRVQRLVYSKL